MISILFVDDEPSLLDVGKIFLEENAGYSVQCALSGAEAIDLMAATKYDAIVADYQMPGMDGITLLKKVRETNKTLPYILFTGRGREEVAIEAINEGADFYLQKGGSAKVQYAELAHKIRIAVERRVAEAAFKESEERLRTVMTSIQVGIVTVDAKTHAILDVNPKAAEIIGAPPHEIIGNVCHRFICPAQAGGCPVTDLGQKVDLSERVLLNKKGEKIPILKSVQTTHLAGKDVLIETFFDIAERKRSEQAFQTLMKSMLSGTGLASFNAITASVSTWLGADFSLITEFMEDERYAQVISVQPGCDKIPTGPILLKGTPCGMAAEKGFSLCADNAQQVFPDCGMLGVLNIRSYVGSALKNSDGKVIGTLCSYSRKPLIVPPQIQDIFEMISVKAAAELERKQNEKELENSEGRLRTLIGSMNDLIFVLDTNFVFKDYYQSTTDLLYIHPEQFLGKRIDEIHFPEPAFGIMKNALLYTRETGNPSTVEYYLDITRGRSWFDLHVTPYTTSDGTRTGLTCVVRDITERKRADVALQQVNKKLTLLSGITRHEINNHLIALDGYITILEKKAKDPALGEYFQKSAFSLKRIASMIKFTKEYEKIGVHAPLWYEVRALIGNEEKQSMLGRIRLDNNLPAGTEILADPLISLVIDNLIDNALRYGEKITTIRVSLNQMDGDRTLIFEDDGVGVPVDEKEKIFAYGYGKNTGMGLFLAREILDITGIGIRESGEPGTGARFEVMVPKGMWRETEAKTGGK